jgi:hypothetical protein
VNDLYAFLIFYIIVGDRFAKTLNNTFKNPGFFGNLRNDLVLFGGCVIGFCVYPDLWRFITFCCIFTFCHVIEFFAKSRGDFSLYQIFGYINSITMAEIS